MKMATIIILIPIIMILGFTSLAVLTSAGQAASSTQDRMDLLRFYTHIPQHPRITVVLLPV